MMSGLSPGSEERTRVSYSCVKVSRGCSLNTPEGQVHEVTQPLCWGQGGVNMPMPVTPNTPLTSLSKKINQETNWRALESCTMGHLYFCVFFALFFFLFWSLVCKKKILSVLSVQVFSAQWFHHNKQHFT